jgi:hypothetical protein
MRAGLYFVKSGLLLSCMIGVFMLTGCKPRMLPSTNVPATKENRRVVKFFEQFKSAIEKKSVDGVMELIAKDFSDNLGSEDPALRLNYLTLKEKLEKTFEITPNWLLGLYIQHIAKIDKENYEVGYYYNVNAFTQLPSGNKWITQKEVKRMVIRKRHDKTSPYEFEILQGI